MGLYSDCVLPYLVQWTMGTKVFDTVRDRALSTARGTVLEIGFGTGLNLPHYPKDVSRLLAVEPSSQSLRIARKAIAAAPFPVEVVGLDGQELPLAGATVDTAVSTWTLCTIPDAAAALREVARVLRPEGRLLFAEHGLSPDAGVARWQRRLDGLQQAIAGGCHLTRKMDDLVAAAPFTIETLDTFYIKGPRTHAWFYVGTARKRG
jgi:ubiquinone/menaquinone biosynthesis C-methylase UbiE